MASFLVQVSDTLSVSSVSAFLRINEHDGQSGLFAPLPRTLTLASLVCRESLGRRHLAAPDSPDSPFTNCYYNWKPFACTRRT